MTQADVIIIGAGAAGLMAGRALVKAGRNVLLLEARERIGGRIYQHTGAEFIHGDQPLTQRLLKEAGIPFYSIPSPDIDIPHWQEFVAQLKALPADMPLHAFLETRFPEEQYAAMKETIELFASGYDTANPYEASAFAMRDEWLSDDEPQYRIAGGYDLLANYLAGTITKGGGRIQQNAVVNTIQWQPGKVEITTEDAQVYTAQQVLITVPLGVLQAQEGEKGSLQFFPPLPDKREAITKIGMGGVIKLLLTFREAFWENSPVQQPVSFVFSKEAVPTWWTQYPERSSLLTGWLGGPAAKMLKDAPDERILASALDSLAAIFHMHTATLQSLLISASIINWTADPFTRGSYTYATIDTDAAQKVLSIPVAGTLFFAGEGLYEGVLMGTVEAALASGEKAAAKMLQEKR
jgi:monoamine oxidase